MEETKAPKKHISTAVIYAAPLVCLLALATVLNTTNPLDSGPASILFVFVLLYGLFFSIMAAVLHVAGAVLRMVRPQKRVALRRGYYVVSVVSLAPVMLVALNTLGRLEALEFTLIILLVALGCFYVLRRSAK